MVLIDLSLKDQSKHILELDYVVEKVSLEALIKPPQELYDKIVYVVLS